MIRDDNFSSGFKYTDIGNMATTTTTLPPVRTANYLPQALAPTISEETISLWLKLGAMEKLEQAVLDGYGDLLIGRTARLPQVNKFLRQVPMFQNKIYEIHCAVSKGKLRELQHLVDRKKLAACRDHVGATPLHKAVIFGYKDIILYLLDRYDITLHIRDHQGRTPLHYAAFLLDGGEIYQILVDAGADTKAIDAYGNLPEHYMKIQDETALQELRDGYLNNDIRKIKPRKSNSTMNSKKGYFKSTVGRVQIKELINKGNLEALEDIILRGHGGLLLGETSPNPTINDFLTMVPFYLKRIHDVHRAAMRGRLQEITGLLDHKSFAIATDQLGATPLHKAVWYENYDVAEYIVNNFPLSLNITDMDGRTPLHYAAVLRDNKDMYNILLNGGASKSVQDIKGKTADYYLQHPELLKIDEVIRRNQRINATHMANIINHTRSKLPLRQTPPSMGKDGFSSSSTSEKSGQEQDDEIPDIKNEEKDNEDRQHTPSNVFDTKTESLIKSLPPLPPLKLQRLEITSANIRKWMSEEDLDKLKQAVIDGYGEMIGRENPENKIMQEYITHSLPLTMDKISAIHNAVSRDDLTELRTQLENEELVPAKDNFGMTSLHKAVILGHTKIVKFLTDNFPEIINITDKDGRTALHYATAASRKESINIYRILIQASADPKIRDMQGRTADYYRTHRMPTTLKSPMKPKTSPNLIQNQSEYPTRPTKQGVMEKITSTLQKGDIEMLKEIVLEGYGKHLLGRTSWNEDVRQYLKTLPQYLATIRSLQEAVIAGDINTIEKRIKDDEKLLKSKDESGLTPIHLAIIHNKPEIVSYLTTKYPIVLNVKDTNGRTPLHLAAQENHTELYRLIKDNGADPMILDQKGRSAEFYLSEKEDEKSPRTPISSENNKLITNEESTTEISTNDEKQSNNLSEETVLVSNTDISTSGQNDAKEEKENNSELEDPINSDSKEMPNPEITKEIKTASVNENETNDTTEEKKEETPKHISVQNETSVEENNLQITEEDNKNIEDNQKNEENVLNNNEPEENINNSDKIATDDKKSENVVTTDHSESKIPQDENQNTDSIPEEVPNSHVNQDNIGIEKLDEKNGESNPQEDEKNEENNPQEDEKNEEESKPQEDEKNEESNPQEDEKNEEESNPQEDEKENILQDEKNEESSLQEDEKNEMNSTSNPETKTESDQEESKLAENTNSENKKEELEITKSEDQDTNSEINETATLNPTEEAADSVNRAEDNNNNITENNIENTEQNTIENSNVNEQTESKPDDDKSNTENHENSTNEIDTEKEIDNNKTENNVNPEVKKTEENNNENDKTEKDSENIEEDGDKSKEIQPNTENAEKQETSTETNDLKENDKNSTNNQESIKTNNDDNIIENEKQTNPLENDDTKIDSTNDAVLTKQVSNDETGEQNNNEEQIDNVNTNNEPTNINLETVSIEENDKSNTINESLNLESNAELKNDKEESINNSNSNIKASTENLKSETESRNHADVESNQNNSQTVNTNYSYENKNNSSNRIKTNSGIKNRNTGSRNSSQKDYLDDLIEQWIKEGDLLRLEHVVLAGQGDRLIEKTSDDKQVQDFLDLVPIYTAKIRAIHEAVIRGNLREVRAVLTRKRFALSRDHVGASPLHLAVLHRHADIVQYIISHFPETMDGPDNEGRTPLHYAAVIPDEGYLYKIIKAQGADENIKDKMGMTPKYYLENGGQLTVQDLWDSYKSGEEQ